MSPVNGFAMNVIPLYRQDVHHREARVCASCTVRESALFGVLDDDALDDLHLQIAHVELQPDQRLYARGDTGGAVYTVREGMVRFERVTERGDRRIVRIAGPGDLIGQEALLQRSYADEAIACTPVRLCRIPRGLIEEVGASQPPLLRELMLRWQVALDAAEVWASDLSTGPARRRLLRLVLRLTQYPDGRGLIWLPRREDMGAMLDMTFETASRLISQLRREGVIELEGLRHARVHEPALRDALQRADML